MKGWEAVNPKRKVIYGEWALVAGILLNSLSVELIVKSGLGMSSISSVPYILSLIMPQLSFGTWNYLIQCSTILLLIGATRTFKIGYLLSFVLAVFFGRFLDLFAAGLHLIPDFPVIMVGCYLAGMGIMSFGIYLLQRCLLPVLPFDVFVRDMSGHFNISFRTFKTGFDVSCLMITILLSVLMLGHIAGVGAGTVIGALFTGTIVSRIAAYMDRRYEFAVKHGRLMGLG